MIVNQLLVLPDDDTLSYLSKVFSACPFDLDLSLMHVEINSSESPMEPIDTATYVARAGTMDIYYDGASQTSSLLLPLDSPALTTRCATLRKDNPSAFYGRNYFPFLVVKRNMPPLARHYRSFIRSISTSLATSEYPLIFTYELQRVAEFSSPPDIDYYVSRLAQQSGNFWIN